MTSAALPNRSLFKAPEVCEIAQLQPYVLRSWEAEFPDLGVVRSGSSARVYRKHDVERVLRLKHLLFVEGLTLAGARRRLEEESTPLPPADEVEETGTSARGANGRRRDEVLRRQLAEVQRGLRSLLAMLESRQASAEFRLHAQPAPRGKPAKPARAAKQAPASKPHRRR